MKTLTHRATQFINLSHNLINFRKSTLTVAIFCAILIPLTQSVSAKKTPSEQNVAVGISQQQISNRVPVSKPPEIVSDQKRARIQVAILLDTSGSMDGLIDQTRNQLWQVVNEFSTTRKNGVVPILEVALFEYGNSTASKNAGYVRKLNSFTRELDKVSEGLFQLTTNGGDEYCGLAIKTAVNGLQWSQNSSDIKTIFIAGNEPFTQGPVNYQDALYLATKAGISVNTIYAGAHKEGVDSGWQSGALFAGGDYMSIDTNQRVVHINAPQDQRIAELNKQLNQTYVPYGDKGKKKALRQEKQDTLSNNISSGLLAQRAKSKVSGFYNNSDWDMVDAVNDGKMAEAEIAELDELSLPKPMHGMSVKEKKDYIESKAKGRTEIKKEIAELARSRDFYVAEQKKKQAVTAPSMSDALTDSMRKQAKEKNFVFVEPESESESNSDAVETKN